MDYSALPSGVNAVALDGPELHAAPAAPPARTRMLGTLNACKWTQFLGWSSFVSRKWRQVSIAS